MTAFATQAGLSSRYGVGLARIASPIATLNGDATSRIAQACADANSQVDAVVSGMGLDLSGPPANLVYIALRLAARRLWVLTWSSRVSSGVPKAFADEANEAETELEAVRVGANSGDGSPPAQTIAGQFSWTNVADWTGETSRQTTRHKMRRLP